jgi:Fe-S cluster biogenesis protein NfuA
MLQHSAFGDYGKPEMTTHPRVSNRLGLLHPMRVFIGGGLHELHERGEQMAISKEKIIAEVGPVAEILKAHDGIVNVIDTTDGIIMISLEGGCVGCSSTPMTAMQMYYHLMQLEEVNDVVFVNGELPEFMRQFIDQKIAAEAEEAVTA